MPRLLTITLIVSFLYTTSVEAQGRIVALPDGSVGITSHPDDSGQQLLFQVSAHQAHLLPLILATSLSLNLQMEVRADRHGNCFLAFGKNGKAWDFIIDAKYINRKESHDESVVEYVFNKDGRSFVLHKHLVEEVHNRFANAFAAVKEVGGFIRGDKHGGFFPMFYTELLPLVDPGEVEDRTPNKIRELVSKHFTLMSNIVSDALDRRAIVAERRGAIAAHVLNSLKTELTNMYRDWGPSEKVVCHPGSGFFRIGPGVRFPPGCVDRYTNDEVWRLLRIDASAAGVAACGALVLPNGRTILPVVSAKSEVELCEGIQSSLAKWYATGPTGDMPVLLPVNLDRYWDRYWFAMVVHRQKGTLTILEPTIKTTLFESLLVVVNSVLQLPIRARDVAFVTYRALTGEEGNGGRMLDAIRRFWRLYRSNDDVVPTQPTPTPEDGLIPNSNRVLGLETN